MAATRQGLEYDQLRDVFLSVLRGFSHGSDYHNLKAQIARVAVDRGYATPDQQPAVFSSDPAAAVLRYTDLERIRQLFWELVVQGVIVVGMNDNSPTWPWFSVTEYGRTVLGTQEVTPYDALGYFRRLRSEVAVVDPIVELYLQESLNCFLRGTYMASAVMLGVASEKVALDLITVVGGSIKEAPRRQKFEAGTKGKHSRIGEAQRVLMDYLRPALPTLPDTVADEVPLAIDAIFNVIRIYRNQSGHPTGRSVSRDIAYANLLIFPTYYAHATRLMEYLKTHSLPQP